MAARQGQDLLLKTDNTGFVAAAGLRTKRIAFNGETVDITDADYQDNYIRNGTAAQSPPKRFAHYLGGRADSDSPSVLPSVVAN